jgi:A/G-specific adenine glycosylase
MLQQTRVAAVIPYYGRFLERFPDVASLAGAEESEVIEAWSGLGYYSRARNLRKAAREVVERGGFPRDCESLRQLPGIGDYTAAAIASIAFGLPHAVLDGNVARVLSRLTGEKGDIGSGRTRRRLGEFADELLDRRHPGYFNQALMELGATLCLPREPQCLLCPVSGCCEARRLGMQNELPVKLRRSNILRIRKTLLIIEEDGKLLLRMRTGSPMAGFWELPEEGHLQGAQVQSNLGRFRHSITNHSYTFDVVSASVKKVPAGFEWLQKDRLGEYPLSTVARKALQLFGFRGL